MGRLTLLGTAFVIHSQPVFFVAEALFALFAQSCIIAQFSVLESVFHEKRAMVCA
jgi:hypothetical protein